MAWIGTDENGRINCVTEKKEYAAPDAVEMDLPEDFDASRIWDYVVQDGQIVESPKPPSEEELAAQQEAERQAQIQTVAVMMVQTMSASLTDAQALTVPLLFSEWKDLIGQKVKADTVIRHEGELYRVAQETIVQEQYPPGDGTESLYTHITIDPETGYEVWKRPEGAHDAYSYGDRVLYPDENGQVYESTVEGEHTNTWEPGVFGWELVEGGE